MRKTRQADELIRARFLVTALINPSLASEWPCPRGSSTWRSRNSPVSRKPSCRSWSDQPFAPPSPSRRNGRQPQQPVPVGLAGPPRHRAAGFRRDVDQVSGRAGGGAVFQIEAEAEFGEHREFEPDEVRRRAAGIVEIVQRAVEHLVDVLVRIALRQQPRQRGQMGHAIDRVRGRQQDRRAQPRAFERVGAEMFVEPRPPHGGDAVAGLQQRPHPRRGTAPHEAEMAAVAARQQFDDGGGFAMPPHPEHDAFVGPFHGGSLQDFAEGRSGSHGRHSGAMRKHANPESRDSGFACFVIAPE